MPLPIRKKNRLEGYNYQEYGGYFVTLCSAERKPIFWADANEKNLPNHSPRLSAIGKTIQDEILHVEKCYSGVYVDKYIIMPNHIHLVIFLQNQNTQKNPSISRIIQQFKGSISKKNRKINLAKIFL